MTCDVKATGLKLFEALGRPFFGTGTKQDVFLSFGTFFGLRESPESCGEHSCQLLRTDLEHPRADVFQSYGLLDPGPGELLSSQNFMLLYYYGYCYCH